MEIKLKGMCRGDGKIFVKVEVKSSDGNGVLSLTNSDEHGHPLPVKLLPYVGAFHDRNLCKPHTLQSSLMPDGTFRGAFVVVLPNLPIKKQYLTFTLANVEGEILDQAEQTIDGLRAKWESRLNYKINHNLTKAIRNYDDYVRPQHLSVKISEVIPCPDEAIKVRLTIRSAPNPRSSIEVEVFTRTGEKLDVQGVVIDDAIHPDVIYGGDGMREIKMTFDFPTKDDYYLFLVSSNGDETQPSQSDFVVLEPGYAQCLMGVWWENHKPAGVDERYERWFAAQRVTPCELEKQRNARLELTPKFSIVVPVYRTPLHYFDEMVNSVRAQSYENWQLILVNASPDDASLTQAVHVAATEDERVTVVTMEENLGISGNTLAGIAKAEGDFVCFFDHDDLLEPDILFEYALAVNDDPQTDLLYCDEDKLTEEGKLESPIFKPEFSIDLLRNCNVVTHLLCIRKSLLDTLEYPTSEYDGAQDHDITLKVAEKTTHIHRVPKVLYHWRAIKGSTAADPDAKPYAALAGQLAVRKHLERMGLRAEVTPAQTCFSTEVRYLVDDINPLISIIIPTKDNVSVLDTCLQSIFEKSTYQNYEIILVENNSTDAATFDYYNKLQETRTNARIIKWEHEFNFSKLINFGEQHAQGEYLVLLNNDTEVITPDWLERMLGICRREDVGIVGVRLWYPDDTLQHAGVALIGGRPVHLHVGLPRGNNGNFFYAGRCQALSAVTAACLMVRKTTFNEVGGFDPEFAVAFNDVDFCFKVRELGLLVIYCPEIELYHFESLSRGYEKGSDKLERFQRELGYLTSKWPSYAAKGDPYYSKNFNQINACYSLGDIQQKD